MRLNLYRFGNRGRFSPLLHCCGLRNYGSLPEQTVKVSPLGWRKQDSRTAGDGGVARSNLHAQVSHVWRGPRGVHSSKYEPLFFLFAL